MDESPFDEALMLGYRDGDAQAFEILYRRHRAPLYRYCLRMAWPAAVAEELFQDIWMNVIKARATYEVRAKFTTWLYRLAHNRLVDHYRRSTAGLPLPYDGDADEALIESVADESMREPDGALERRRLAQRLAQALSALPEAQREAFLLREEGRLSLAEIAAASGVTMETAKSRLRYAVAKLRQALAAEAAPPPARERGKK